MKILFITLLNYYDISEHGIYTDLMREFVRNNNSVYIVSPTEKKQNEKSTIIKQDNVEILKPQIGNYQKTNLIEKGLSLITLEGKIKKEIERYWSDVIFDLIIYSTPPITLTGVVSQLKKRCNAKTYLLLKDIFPQNSVDLGMLKVTGLKGIIYKYFREKEKRIYSLSDRIGCMSQANVDYVIKNNPEVDPNIVEICPNCIEPVDTQLAFEGKWATRDKYEIPREKKIFVYGGNLGKPQDIPFVIECIKVCKEIEDAFFLIVGSGTDYGKLLQFVKDDNPKNMKLIKQLPKDEYDIMIASCDVGLIFLDHRFTIPNFPSRLLSYMQVGLPVLASTDINTDIGEVIVNGDFGWWCESTDPTDFRDIVQKIVAADLEKKKENGKKYLLENYTVENIAQKILAFPGKDNYESI